MATPANINTLNQFAKGLFQDTANPVADFLAPVVTTGAAQFFVIDYAKRSGFQVPNSKRAIGGTSKAVQTDGERVQITLNPNALHDFIDNHELDLAGTSEGQKLLREARTRNLVSQAGNSRLAETLAVLRAGTSAVPEVWGAGDDPVADIDGYIKAVSDSIGILPNRILFSLGAWSLFRGHAKTIARHPGAAQVSIQAGTVGSLFLNPNVKVEIATTVFDTPLSAPGVKKNALDVGAAAEVYVYYAAESADQFDASFAKTFRVQKNAFQALRMRPKDHGEKWILDWTETAYVNNPAAGVRLQVTAS